MDTAAPDPWTALALDLETALLALPGDGLLDLLLPGHQLTASWLVHRALLELSGAPPGRAPALLEAGWTSRRARCWARTVGHGGPRAARSGRPSTAAAAAEALVVVLRDVLQVAADDVELWLPGVWPTGLDDVVPQPGQPGLW